uniref:BicC family RNA binding protein 1b n=1 Tax=Sinocyclocheilus rhinocerous TaxID=307959 RepID=A0A673G859_9TELE
MEQLDVFISVKPKPKQPSKVCLLGPMTASMTGPSTNSLLNSIILYYIILYYIILLLLLGFSSPLMIHPATQATLTSILLSGVPGYTQNTPSPPPGLAPIDAQVNGVSDCTVLYISHTSLADKVLTAAHGDSVQEASPHCPSEPLSSKSSQDRGSDTFVEVGMPRSPSHSGNSNELKQMLASCKTTSGKRQALELLQGTKNSLLQYDHMHNHSTPKHSLLSLCSPLQAFDYEQKKLLATKAMLKKPVVTEVRTPTNTWSGLGFSKSMPAETIKELRRANHVSYKPTMSTTYEGSPLALSRSNSREGVASGSDSDNWRERNGSGLPVHSDFPSPISPKRKQNKTGVLFSRND